MIRIWREGGWLERLGVVVGCAAFVSCWFDVVDLDALPKALDKLVIAFPLMLAAFVFVLGGQQMRHAKARRERDNSTG